jgi:hypothetical protein
MASKDAGKAPLTGMMTGPINSTGTEKRYRLRPSSGSNEYVEVGWRDIHWIKGHPTASADMNGATSDDLGEKTIWLREDAVLKPDSFMVGDITSTYPTDSVTETSGVVEWNAYNGPMGTTYPPCLCPR